MSALRKLADKVFRFAAIVGLYEGNVMGLAQVLDAMEPMAKEIVDGLGMKVPLKKPIHQMGPANHKLVDGIYAIAEEVAEGERRFFRVRIGFDDREMEEAMEKRARALPLMADFMGFKDPLRVLWLIMNLDEVMQNLEDLIDGMPELKDAEEVKKILKRFVGTLAVLKECLKE